MFNIKINSSAISLLFFGSFIFWLSSSSLAPKGVIDHFKVGDVINSVLDPSQFKKVHGDGWELAAGQEISPNSDLRRLYASQLVEGKKLPDGRGVFIRGMNVDRPQNGDTGGNRLVGHWQADGIARHKHPLDNHPDSRYWYLNAGGSGCAIQYSCPGRGNTQDNLQRAEPSFHEGSIDETRPRNISLYTYIKISEE